MDQRGKMKNKFKIVLNTDDVVHNRKILSVKLPVWKKLISVSCYEQTPISKVINKAITKYIEENNYDIETIFKNNVEVKEQRMDSLIDYDFNVIDQIEYK
jgi:hypothetical protein